MKRAFQIVFLTTATGAMLLTAAASMRGETTSQQASSVTAFVNVDVIPMDDNRVLQNQTVVVSRGRIIDLGPASRVVVPGDATRINGTGKFLMPGLAEMHGHTPSGEFAETVMFLYLANGVTTVRGMLGQDGHLALKAQTNSGDMIGPTLYLAGPSFNGPSIRSPEQAAQRVRNQHAEGWDLLKIHPGLTLAEYEAMALTAAEVGIRFGGHVPEDVGLIRAIQLGQQTFDHLDGYLQYVSGDVGPIDQTRLAEAVRLTKDANAWVVPTMVLWERGIIGLGDVDELRASPDLVYWPSRQVDGWANRMEGVQQRADFDLEMALSHARNRRIVLKALSDAGVGILMGTDSPQIFSVPGFSLHREMEAMAEAGMSPYEILKSGTKNVGEYFQGQDTFGTVAVGRRADLILLDVNPLVDIRNVRRQVGVMVRGRWLPQDEIDARLEQIAAEVGER